MARIVALDLNQEREREARFMPVRTCQPSQRSQSGFLYQIRSRSTVNGDPHRGFELHATFMACGCDEFGVVAQSF